MLVFTDKIKHLWRQIKEFWINNTDNPLLWLACFLLGILIFKIVWNALSKEK